MTDITLDQLKENVKMWSETRGILAESNYEAQISKFFEERGELFTTNDIEESYGNQMVCLINAKHLRNTRTITPRAFANDCLSDVEEYLSVCEIDNAIIELDCEIILGGFDPQKCYGKALDEIKKRAGLMINKKFVKWDNLTHEQRIKTASMGQLLDKNIDLVHCASFCTDKQWGEICAAEKEYTESL